MKPLLLISVSAIFSVAILSACVSTAIQSPKDVPAAAYVLDPAHARLNWSIDHRGLSKYTARFDSLVGALDFDPAAPEKSYVFIKIDPASVSTGDVTFDTKIATDTSYFDAGAFPEITFESTSIVVTSDTTGDITGDLTFLGVTQPVTLSTTFNGVADSFMKPGRTIGFDATGSFKRSDFGLTHLLNLGIGDEITLDISVEFNETEG